MEVIDIVLFVVLGVVVMGMGLWVGYSRKDMDAHEFFLSGGKLGGWMIGGALIASNISAEQFIGMSGVGYKVGIAVASYELMAAASLVVIAFLIIPFFLHHKIQTMPQFIEKRYNKQTKTLLAVYWVGLFVFVNISSVLYLGSLAIEKMGINRYGAIGVLVAYAAATSIVGGLTAVVWTEVVQLFILVGGGLLATYYGLTAISPSGTLWDGWSTLTKQFPEHFHLILSGEHPAYSDYPGWGMVFGGIWIANLYYWGMNQYIIQRALGAKNIYEAQKGMLIAGFIKILMPLIVVLPGIIMLYHEPGLSNSDESYPMLLGRFLPSGVKGLAFAALTAAVGSSISAMVNSASTIFTLDIYQTWQGRALGSREAVRVGRIASAVALGVGALLAPALENFGQAFTYIQKYTGYLSPGVVVIFLFGILWRATSTQAAIAVVIASLPLSWALDYFTDLPFLHQMGISFLCLSGLIITLSAFQNGFKSDEKHLSFPQFQVPNSLKILTLAIIFTLIWVYVKWR